VYAVRTGGYLFELYLGNFAGFTSYNLWLRWFAAHCTDRSLPSAEAVEKVVVRERGGFHGWVLKSVSSIGNTGKRQMFFTTFVARYFGLSRMGVSVLANFGFATSQSQYDTIKRETLVQARAETR
jgi:hypothetical protein